MDLVLHLRMSGGVKAAKAPKTPDGPSNSALPLSEICWVFPQECLIRRLKPELRNSGESTLAGGLQILKFHHARRKRKLSLTGRTALQPKSVPDTQLHQ